MEILQLENHEDFLHKPTDLVESKLEAFEIGQQLIDVALPIRKNCLGLSANQIGIDKFVFIALIKNKYTIFANTKILSKSQRYTPVEGCLSIKDKTFKVERWNMIEIEDMIHGVKKFYGVEAQIIQHEMSHCSGRLIVDEKV